MAKSSKIEIFVLTCNRLAFLKESLESLFAQTLPPLRISVMDNASSDGTSEYLDNLAKERPDFAHVRHAENIGGGGNFESALHLAEADYVMFFHDDDILHPRYVEFAEKLTEEYPGIALMSSDYVAPKEVNGSNWEDVSSGHYLCKGRESFAAFLYGVGRIAFSCAIYRREYIANKRLDTRNFGKICDKIFMLDAVPPGAYAAVFSDKRLLRYRIHAGQDTKAVSSGPFYGEIVKHNKFFRRELNGSLLGRAVFEMCCYRNLKSLYNMGDCGGLSLVEFIDRAHADGAASALTQICARGCGKPLYGLCNIGKAVFSGIFPRRSIFGK